MSNMRSRRPTYPVGDPGPAGNLVTGGAFCYRRHIGPLDPISFAKAERLHRGDNLEIPRHCWPGLHGRRHVHAAGRHRQAPQELPYFVAWREAEDDAAAEP